MKMRGISMTTTDLSAIYRDYIACLNRQDWAVLGDFVHQEARHNGRLFGVAGYRAMLEKDFSDIPDLQFNIQLLVTDQSHVASRLAFDCTPSAEFVGLAVNGRKISFTENVFYRFSEGKIIEVWSVIDKVAIEAQLLAGRT
jgi:predicted ester cyclase